MDRFRVGDKVILRGATRKKVFEIVGIIGDDQPDTEYLLEPLDNTRNAAMTVFKDDIIKITGNDELIRILYG